ncbi:Dcp1p-Dcp2p decapping enzyme complex alpha subunit, partial [Mortierella sp. GBA39]
MQQLASEEYFVTEKFASVRCMLLSTNTPKGPACFLIDRHNEISFVPHLLLPLRDNPTKYQNETLLDGEMVTEHDGHKTTLRFLVFDLMILNGADITQRSYSSRLGMLDQDILGVHASKSSDVKAKEPFTIERKTMQRSYGLNIILSASRKQKQGAEGLIFVPVKQPYISGASPKLLKWKSHTTAQFQIKVTLSKERKPLYCIHVKQGPSSKFYDYVTPDSVQAAEWHTTSPDGKIAEFWWDAQWQTQMFEKGYGLETRTGGWRFNRIREDKKDVDEENTVLALVKSLETLVTKEQLEASIDHIRKQWKAREAGTSSNGSNAHSSAPSQRPPMRPLSISNNASSHPDSQAPLLTPAISSHYLQSPSVASHSSSQGYFSRKDRERKASMDEHGSLSSLPTSISGTFSHPLPPKPPPYQPRQSSVDRSQPCSPNPPGAGAKNSDQEQQTASPSPAPSAPAQSAQNSDGKSTPPTSQPETATGTATASAASTGTATATTPSTATTASSATTTSTTTTAITASITPSATTAPTVATTPAAATTPATAATPTTTVFSTAYATVTTSPTNLARNPLKLSQVQAHLQPIKSWMTVAPVPRAPLGEKTAKLGSERRDSRDSSSLDTPHRQGLSSRKSSVVSTEGAKDAASATANASAKSQESKGSTSINTGASNTLASSAQDRPPQTPQTPTSAQTPTIAGTSRSGGTPSLSAPVSFAHPNIALPNIAVAVPNTALTNIALPNIALPSTLHQDTDESTVQDTETETKSTTQASDTAGVAPPITSPTVKPIRNPSVSDVNSSKPSPVLGKRTVASTSSAGDRPDDSLAQRRKLSDAMQPSPKSEAVMVGIGSLNLASTFSPKSNNVSSFPPNGAERGSPLLSPLGSPGIGAKPGDHQQPWSRSQQTSGSRALKASNLAHEVPPCRSQGPVDPDDVAMAEVKDEANEPASRPLGGSNVAGLKEDVEMEDIAPKIEKGHVTETSRGGPPPQRGPTADDSVMETVVKAESTTASVRAPTPSLYPPPTPAFVMAAQGTYNISEDQEKARAMAMARAAASSKLDRQLELQTSKDERLLEDIEKFKESSRTKKEKPTKQRTQEVIEPPAQDRRSQPVRQINQQQGRQPNPDSPALRGQSQLGQRVGSSPQEQQQRLAYATRQSRSGPRVDPAQTPPVNVKPQHRPEQQQPVPIEQIDPTGGQVSKGHVHRDQFPGGARPDSREQIDMLHPEDAPRQHRRVNSMDNRFQQSRPASPSRFDPGILQQQGMPDGRYGQLHSKRLDLGQHGDPKHRRSHSDVGTFYKPIVTAIVAPQAIGRQQQGPLPTEVAPLPQVPPLGQPGVEYRQNGQFSQGQQRPSPTGPRPEMDDSWMRHSNNGSNDSSSVKEAPPVKESKARLQFILNDDPTSPEGEHHDDDPMELPRSPEAPDWGRSNPTAAESAQRVHAHHGAYLDQPHMANDYPMRDHQEAQMALRVPPSMMAANPTRRQPSKKQKLSQDMTGQDPAFNGTPEEYEYHLRQSQQHPQARPSPHVSQQRPPFPGDRWPQQGSTQQHPPQQPMAMQGQPQSSAGPPPTGGRRVGGEVPVVVHQQPSHHFSGPDMSQHGPSMGRPPHPDQYGAPGHGGIMEGSRPKPERLSHSRHSSVSKAGPGQGPEQVQPPAPAHPNARTKAGLPHGSSPVVEQYPRGYPQPPPGAVPGQPRPAPPSQHQPPYQPSPQQQPQANSSMASRKKAAAEQQSGPYGPPPP